MAGCCSHKWGLGIPAGNRHFLKRIWVARGVHFDLGPALFFNPLWLWRCQDDANTFLDAASAAKKNRFLLLAQPNVANKHIPSPFSIDGGLRNLLNLLPGISFSPQEMWGNFGRGSNLALRNPLFFEIRLVERGQQPQTSHDYCPVRRRNVIDGAAHSPCSKAFPGLPGPEVRLGVNVCQCHQQP